MPHYFLRLVSKNTRRWIHRWCKYYYDCNGSCMTNGLNIRRPKKKRNIMNDTRIKRCIARFDAGSYNRIQFLRIAWVPIQTSSGRLLTTVTATLTSAWINSQLHSQFLKRRLQPQIHQLNLRQRLQLRRQLLKPPVKCVWLRLVLRLHLYRVVTRDFVAIAWRCLPWMLLVRYAARP